MHWRVMGGAAFVFGVGICGAVAGATLVPRVAAACDCGPTIFELTLRSVTSSEPQAGHGSLWPHSGEFTSYESAAKLTFNAGGRQDPAWVGAVR